MLSEEELQEVRDHANYLRQRPRRDLQEDSAAVREVLRLREAIREMLAKLPDPDVSAGAVSHLIPAPHDVVEIGRKALEDHPHD